MQCYVGFSGSIWLTEVPACICMVVTKDIVNPKYISLEPEVLISILNINLRLKNFTSLTEMAERVKDGQSEITS